MTADPPARAEIAALSGAQGDDAQFRALLQRTAELIDGHFDLYQIVGGHGVTVTGADHPVISLSR